MGTVTGSLRFINFPFLEQMPIGVLTNHGIEFLSRPILQSTSKKSHLDKNTTFKGILEEKSKLVKNDKNEQDLKFQEAIVSADRLLEYLLYSEKRSMVSLIYNSTADLMRAQAVLIEIGEHMLEFCEYVDQWLKERYYKILVAIL